MAFPTTPDNGEHYWYNNTEWEYISARNAWELVDYQKLTGVTFNVFSSSGTWTKPANASVVTVVCIGAGGGGDTGWAAYDVYGTLYYGGGSGGGGGAISTYTYDANDLGSTVTVTVGTGGVGGTAYNLVTGSGGDGGASYFGNGVLAGGGGGGLHDYGNGPGVGGYGSFRGGTGGLAGSGSASGLGNILPIDGVYGESAWGGAGGGGAGGIRKFSTGGTVGYGGSALAQSVPASYAYPYDYATPYPLCVPASGGDSALASGVGAYGGKFVGGGGGGGAYSYDTGYFWYGGSGANGMVLVITWYSA